MPEARSPTGWERPLRRVGAALLVCVPGLLAHPLAGAAGTGAESTGARGTEPGGTAGGAAVVPDTVPAEEETGSDLVLLPFVLYTPETGFGGGGLAGYYTRLGPDVEQSSFIAAVTVTERRQFIVELVPDAYLARGTRLEGELRFEHYPDVFFGVGPGTPAQLEEDYTSRIAELRARAQPRLRPGLRVGVEATLRHERLVEVDEEGALAEGTVRGSEGGFAAGVGPVLTLDGRDNRFSPRRGSFVELAWIVHDGLLGSDFDFHRLVLDARRFFPVRESSTLGIQSYVEVTPGPAPFSLLPLLGGDRRMRGYREGRFRDRALAAAQAELRFPLRGRLGGVTFAGIGSVGPRLDDLELGDPEVAAGIGLRFRITDEGASLRGDFALGREGTGLYLTLGQAF